jgi:Uma2 family endonuclease
MSATEDPNRLYTADDLARMDEDARYELVRGELRVMEPPPHPAHGAVAMRLSSAVSTYVYANGLGPVFTAEAGFLLRRNPDTVRAPDFAFVRADRVPAGGIGQGYGPVPDLVVEVMSSSDRVPHVWQEVDDYLGAGVRLVWVVDPERRTVAVHEAGEPVRLLSEGDTLSGRSVLPGFQCAVSSLFVDLKRPEPGPGDDHPE